MNSNNLVVIINSRAVTYVAATLCISFLVYYTKRNVIEIMNAGNRSNRQD